ncbi:tetratricopeptide repeat protein [Candidatus Hydrogenedentota bacterium]
MAHYAPLVKKALPRLLIAAPLFLVGAFLFPVPGAFLWLIASCIIAPSIAGIFAEFTARDLFLNSSQTVKPPQGSNVAQAKRCQGLFEEAITEYRKMAELYPQEMWPYAEMVDIATRELKDYERGIRMCDEGLEILESQEHKRGLSLLRRSVERSLSHGEPEVMTDEIDSANYTD